MDVHSLHLDMQNQLASAIKNNLETEGMHRKLTVESVEFKGRRSPTDFERQRDVKDRKGTWGQSVRATVALRDKKTNKVISKKKLTVGTMPVLTNRYSYIVGGREYQVTNQFRRMSGVYTRIADNGQFQAVASSELQGQRKITFDPNTKVIKIQPISGSTTELSIYMLLRATGRTEDEIAKVWGAGIVAANKASYREATVFKKLKTIANKIDPAAPATTPKQAAHVIMSHLSKLTFDPRITQDILGKPHAMLNANALMDSAAELAKISRGEKAPSTYDNIGHKKFMAPPDLLKDHVDRQGSKIRRRVKQGINRGEDNLDKIVRANILGREITRFFREGAVTRLSAEASQVNPMGFYIGHSATTVKGFGGLGSTRGSAQAQTIQSSHVGFLDPVDTGEKLESGLDLPLALGSVKRGQRLYAMMYSMEEQKIVEVDPLVADRSYVAYPDDVEFVGGKPKALKKKVRCLNPQGKFESVPLSKVDFIIPTGQQQFGLAVNMVPFLGNNNGNRVMMGAKQAGQAVGLKYREAPLVQVATSPNSNITFERALGANQAILCKKDGKVTSITSSKIKVKSGAKTKEYNLYDRFPTNDKRGYLDHDPIVKVGDSVKKGQVLADLNFTKDGVMALGTNLEMAYVPIKGYNFEDGVVISQSAAEKLTSEHLHKIERDCTNRIGVELKAKDLNEMPTGSVVISKKMFIAWAPQSARLNPASLQKLDDSGVVKRGAVVEKGDVLIAAIRKRVTDDSLRALKKATRFNSPWGSAEIKWDKDTKGVVSRIVKSGKSVIVYVKTEERMGVGDKIAGRYGNKGIITKVLQDHEMPFYTKPDGKKQHIEVAMHPAAVPGRMNPGQLLEVAASKIAEKTGKPYVVTAFDKKSKDATREMLAELKKHGLSDEENLIDPSTGESIGSVISGKHYTYKLEHMVDKKMTARAGGPNISGLESYGYDLNFQPESGYPSGGQAAGAGGIYALLGHNARANIRDLQSHRSTYERPEKWGDYDSDDYWMSLMNGTPMPAPQPTFAVKKFEAHLKGLGVNPKRSGDEIQLVPMTDNDVLKNCDFEVKAANLVIDGKKGMPEKGGLFDFPEGQVSSSRWGHIKLNRRIINPVYEGPVALLVGVDKIKLAKVLKGTATLANGKSGMDAVLAQIDKVSVSGELEEMQKSVKAMPESKRDKAYKRIKVLKALKKMNLSPRSAYTMSVMPVLPPTMRPISLSSSVGSVGDVDTVDINHLYKQVGIANTQLGTLAEGSTNKMRAEGAHNLYSAVRQAYVEGALNNRGAPISSLLQTITNPKGSEGERQGKEGFFQRKLIKRRADLSGRSTITVEPDLNLDQLGLPRKMAMQIYRPFIVRELKANGYSSREALEKIKKEPKSDVIMSALERIVKNRPLIMKRDPVLHKYGMMGFYPKIVEGKAIRIHPMTVGGFNADFDGDTMAVFVPSSDEAVEEAKRMLPSKNLIGTKNFGLMNTPSWDYAYGIWQMSELRGKPSARYSDERSLINDYKKKVVKMNRAVKLKGKTSSAGRALLWSKMAPELQREFGDEVLYGPEMKAGTMKAFMERIARSKPGLFTRMADEWKNLGALNAYTDAWSYGLKDHRTYASIRDKHLKSADAKVAKINRPSDADRVRIYGEAARKISKETRAAMAKDKNRLWRMTGQSGAMGSKINQVEQMVSSPLQVVDMEGKVVPEPIRKSYAEGFSSADYWTAIPGVRAGTLSRARGTAQPGAVGKSLVNLAIGLAVTEKDCGTRSGVTIPTDAVDMEARYLPSQLKVGNKTYPRNTLITPEVALHIRKHHKSIEVRSTLTCKMLNGVCQHCSGDNATGKKYEIGENVGVNSAHSLSEPTTQMSMNAFHTGGSASGAGSKSVDEFTRLEQLFDMPATLPDSATLAELDGKVERITKDKDAGGFIVIISGKSHRIPTGHELFVKQGSNVKSGQPLCSGPLNPHHLLKYAGMGAARKYLLDELSETYAKFGTRRRHVECIVRQLTNVVEVVSDPEMEHAPGDKMTRQRAGRINEERKKEGLGSIKTKAILKRLQDAVIVNAEGDFMAGMNYREIKQNILNAAAYGGKSDLHGYNPIPGIAYGAEFGKGKKKGAY